LYVEKTFWQTFIIFYFVVSLLADDSAWYFSEAIVVDVEILAVLISILSSVVCSTGEFRFCPEPEIIWQSWSQPRPESSGVSGVLTSSDSASLGCDQDCQIISGSGQNLNSPVEQTTELDIDMSTASISTSNTIASEKYHAESSANKDTTK
jgi:hypothetical protein